MRTASFLTASLAFLSLSLSGCDGGGSTVVPGESGVGDTTITLAYRKLNDTLILLPGTGKPSVYSYCSMDYMASPIVPKLVHDTSEADDDDSLAVHASSKFLLLGGSVSNVGNSSTRYLTRMIYERTGSGNGLVGTWNATFRDSILPLNVSESDTAIQRLRSETAKWSARYKETGASSQLEFTAAGTIVIRVKTGSPAKVEVLFWDRWYGDRYALTVKLTSSNTVTYSSSKTGEVVTVTFAANGDKTYTSTNPKRAPYTTREDPTDVSQCPSDPWFYTFESENFKSSTTLGGRAAESGIGPKPVFLRAPWGF